MKVADEALELGDDAQHVRVRDRPADLEGAARALDLSESGMRRRERADCIAARARPTQQRE
jgi:hypothetical protein